MRILDNSRQIPKTKEYITNKNYCDYLYGYLQTISNWDGIVGHPRFVYKNIINFSRIGCDLDKSRQTISKKFKEMLQGNQDMPPLIRLSQDGKKYQLIYLEGNLAMLVPDDTLKVLVSALSENAISVFVYLFNRYYANGEKPYRFTYSELKNAIGIGSKSHGNNYIIQGILLVLQRIGLLKCSEEIKQLQNGIIVTEHYVTWMTNDINDFPDKIDDQTKDEKRWSLYTKMTGKERNKVC